MSFAKLHPSEKFSLGLIKNTVKDGYDSMKYWRTELKKRSGKYGLLYELTIIYDQHFRSDLKFIVDGLKHHKSVYRNFTKMSEKQFDAKYGNRAYKTYSKVGSQGVKMFSKLFNFAKKEARYIKHEMNTIKLLLKDME